MSEDEALHERGKYELDMVHLFHLTKAFFPVKVKYRG